MGNGPPAHPPTAVATYEYDPFGNIVSQSGDLADLNPLRYRGYYYDKETGLYYLQSRYYDPKIGSFINADAYASTGQGMLGYNMFAYCRNNPVCRIDVTGMADEDCYNDDGELLTSDDIENRNGGGGVGRTSLNSSNGSGRGFSSFRTLKSFLGSAGEGKEWHHVVEQNQIHNSGFGVTEVQNTSNVVAIDASTHRQISALYSSIQPYTGGLTVRTWLAGQSFEFQYQFGMDQLALLMHR